MKLLIDLTTEPETEFWEMSGTWINLAEEEPEVYVRRRVAKYFMVEDGIKLFFGTIVGYSDYYWQVNYDDGDSEDFDVNDLMGQLKIWEINKEKDPKIIRRNEIDHWQRRYDRKPKTVEKWGVVKSEPTESWCVIM